MHESSIVRYTEQVAGEIATRHAGAPLDELRLWLRLAHQREAMVAELYQHSELERRLDGGLESATSSAIRSVVLSIWAHETSHTRFLSSIREAARADGALAELQGRVEGWVTRSVTSGCALARALIAVGASVGQVPEFARELGKMSLLEFLRFNAELETTARMGYQRILQLASTVGKSDEGRQELGFTLEYDVARILCEENFHEAAFNEMSRWVRRAANGGPDASAGSPARALHELCSQNLSAAALERVAKLQNPVFESHHAMEAGSAWVSDGGLGTWFLEMGFEVPVIGGPA